jgi:hypothetical protein
MSNQAADPIELDCIEPGCTEKIVYQRQDLPGIAYDEVPLGQLSVVTAYLECSAGHVHAYRITVSPDG